MLLARKGHGTEGDALIKTHQPPAALHRQGQQRQLGSRSRTVNVGVSKVRGIQQADVIGPEGMCSAVQCWGACAPRGLRGDAHRTPDRRTGTAPRRRTYAAAKHPRLYARDPLRSELDKTAAPARTPARGLNQYAAHHVAQGCQAATRHLPLRGPSTRLRHKKAPPRRGFGSTGQAQIRSGNRRQGAGH